MTTKFYMTRDINGYNGFGLSPSEDKFSTTLSANVAQTLCTVPSNFSTWLAVFSPQVGSDIWVAYNATATLPGGSPSSTVSEHLPSGRYLKAGDTVSCITADTTATIGVMLYAIS